MPKKNKKEKEAAPEKEQEAEDEEEEEPKKPEDAPKLPFDPPARAAEDGGDAKAEAPPAPAEMPAAGAVKVEFKPHTEYPPMGTAVKIEYCPQCGLPPDFCQYGPIWEKCKPWCMEKYPQYYPELCGVSLEDAKKKAAEATESAKVKELPGGKKKREVSPHVTIKKMSRGGRKCVTSVIGLDGFAVKLDDAAKLFKKKFSCGASVVKGENGAPDSVDIQGDFDEEVTALIGKEYKSVPLEKVTCVDGGTKKKGKS